MTDNSFDIVIIGGGPGGYVSAIRAAQLGFKVAVVEMQKNLGGTCLNVGCIPSKALLQASYHYTMIGKLGEFGVEVDAPTMNIGKMLKRKDKVIASLTAGIAGLLKKNKITRFHGKGKILAGNKVAITGQDNLEISGETIIIATGSVVRQLPQLTTDEKRIVSSTGALDFKKVPKTLAIIGGGVIGLEIGSIWARLGCDVTVIERQKHIGTTLDTELALEMQKILTKQGMTFFVDTELQETKFLDKNNVSTICFNQSQRDEVCCDFEKIMVSIGRVAYTQGLGLEKLGVALEPNGMIKTDADLQTNIPGVYAIGDCIKGAMLAHKAEEEGICLVERLKGHDARVNYDVIPSIIYTHPEAASVGKTEDEIQNTNIAYRTTKFPFMANSRARANGETEGWVKLIISEADNLILGAHIINAEAGTLIQEIANVMDFGGTVNDLAMICHAHPTTNEAVREAALIGANGMAIHI